jgi:hypothetical protein
VSLKERLEYAAEKALDILIDPGECRKVLALLAAAEELPGCYADPDCPECQAALKAAEEAVAAMEE